MSDRRRVGDGSATVTLERSKTPTAVGIRAADGVRHGLKTAMAGDDTVALRKSTPFVRFSLMSFIESYNCRLNFWAHLLVDPSKGMRWLSEDAGGAGEEPFLDPLRLAVSKRAG